ncbi:MAG TPA: diacylglycerol kinase family protein [Ktedonobacterales bacterium]
MDQDQAETPDRDNEVMASPRAWSTRHPWPSWRVWIAPRFTTRLVMRRQGPVSRPTDVAPPDVPAVTPARPWPLIARDWLRRRLESNRPRRMLARVAPEVYAVTRGLTRRTLRALRQLPAPFSTLYLVVPGVRVVPRLTGRVVRVPRIRRLPVQARLIVNPASGALHAHGPMALHAIHETARWLGKQGLPTEIRLTDGPESARRLAAEAAEAGLRVVIAVGGDGTINDVIQALAGTETALGVLPMGTINVWAREAGIPLGLADARRVLIEGVRRRVDLGRAGDRYFLLMAGIGVDAEVALRVQRHFFKRIGLKLLSYVTTGGMVGLTRRPVKVWIQRDGGRHRSRRIVQIVIGNTRLHAGIFAFTPHAVADDGQLDVVTVGGRGLLDRADVVVRAVLRRRTLGPNAPYHRVRTFRIDAREPLPVQVDGEVIGSLPMSFSVAPLALTVVVPRDSLPDLFLHPPLPD